MWEPCCGKLEIRTLREASVIKKIDLNSGKKKMQNKSLVKLKRETRIMNKQEKKSHALLSKRSCFSFFFIYFLLLFFFNLNVGVKFCFFGV